MLGKIETRPQRSDQTTMTPIPATRNRLQIGKGMTALLWASVTSIALWYIPVASSLLYPIQLFVTYIHEGSHALMTILTGGAVASVTVQRDTSGLTYSNGGWPLLIAPAGYIGATTYGAVLLRIVRRQEAANCALIFSGIAIGLLTLFMDRPWINLFGWVAGILMAAALIVAGVKLPPRAAQFTAMFLAIQCCLDALLDLRVLIGLSTLSDGPVSDATNMARMTFLPSIFWALAFAAVSVLILYRVLAPMCRNPATKRLQRELHD